MARKAQPTPTSREVALNEATIIEDTTAANSLALAHREADTRARAVAVQLGYQLPADSTDPDLIQRDIAANMRRSVEACLEVGKGLRVLREATPHGHFMSRVEALGIEASVARRFMDAAVKFSKRAAPHVLAAAGNQSKLFELLVLDDEQLEELELTGQTGELALDDVATMSMKELRTAVRELRGEEAASKALLEKKNAKIDALSRRIKRQTPDEALKDLQAEATSLMNDALGCIRGNLRQAILAVRNHGDEDHTPFLAGLLGQVQADLVALREEFGLPDVSSASDLALAGEMAQWNK